MPTKQEFDYSVNLLKVLLWQYNEAANVESLLTQKQNWYNDNQKQFWTDWYNNVFNLDTANDFGCIVWAIILGFPTTLITNAVPNSKTPFGFDVTNLSNFNNYNFSGSGTSQISFTVQEKRLILKLRYRQLIARGTIPEINKILFDLINPVYGFAYMLDGLDMTQRLICTFPIPFKLDVILTKFDLLPRPAGVELQVVSSTSAYFGFGPTNTNFGHGGFDPF